MKNAIHPQVYTDTTVTCVCGNSFVTTSTKQTISVEICSNCHPFYTGQQKFVDTEGRIEKFAKKLKLSKEKKEKAPVSKKSTTSSKQVKPKVSLKEILESSKKEEKSE